MTTPDTLGPSSSASDPAPPTASFITLNFGGYFTCRVTTDPDPTDDPWGTSGYTMALGGEPVLDQIIHLQPSPSSPLRASGLPDMANFVARGVRVESVSRNGEPDRALTELLAGATVDLAPGTINNSQGQPQKKTQPKFISHNNVVGSDDTMAFVIEPFKLKIKKRTGHGTDRLDILIKGVDVLDRAHPTKSAVEFANPKAYARRLSYSMSQGSAAAHQAIGVYDEYGYFRDRREWLETRMKAITATLTHIAARIDSAEQRKAELDEPSPEACPLHGLTEQIRGELGESLLSTLAQVDEFVTGEAQLATDNLRAIDLRLATELQNCKSRVYQLDAWGDRVINKLGFQTNWKHSINYKKRALVRDADRRPCEAQLEKLLGGRIITDEPWQIDYWFGGWDGDLLTGYMQGSLQLPFQPL